MTGIDATQGKLIFPPRFVPYLEKHRIFELFYELAEVLIQERPKDHVKFLREALPCAAGRRNKPRIVFLAPPSFDRAMFAEKVANILGIRSITRFYLEMKEREKKLLERLKREAAMGKSVEEEELSCVCPGEIEYGEHETSYSPFKLHWSEGEAQSLELDMFEESPKSSVKEENVEEEEEDPCKGIRVCRCKDQDRDGFNTNKFEIEEVSSDEVGDRIPVNGDGRNSTKSVRETESSNRNSTKSETETESSQLESCICESENIVVDYGVLGKCEYSEKGWILVDFPQDEKEAEHLSEQGAIPTHAIRFITGEEDEKNRKYKYMSVNWCTMYRSVPVTDIHVNGRSAAQLANDLSKLLRFMPHRHAPMLPRIVLIGSRGSGATTQAKLLSEKYNLVHVEFHEEMSRVLLRDDKFSEMYKRQLTSRPDPELEAAILEKILLSPKCRKRGWVLTGYPTNIDQLRMLDLIATPPNRIIFLEVPAKECFVRLYYRKIDSTDGKEYKLPVVEGFGVEGVEPKGVDPQVRGRLKTHPRDDKRRIIEDIERYFGEKEEMMKYCGRTGVCINGNKRIECVFELIDEVLIKPSPAEPPRNPLAVGYGIEEAFERLQNLRMDSGIFINNLLANPPDPIFKM